MSWSIRRWEVATDGAEERAFAWEKVEEVNERSGQQQQHGAVKITRLPGRHECSAAHGISFA